MTADDQSTVEVAETTWWAGVSGALAEAFHDDPVFSWLLPDPATRSRALRRFFEIEARDVVLGHRHSVAVPVSRPAGEPPTRCVGAALVLPPDRWRTPFGVLARRGYPFARIFGARLPRAFGLLSAMEHHHPRERHHYLPYIGVAPSAQGRGLGTAMLEPVLRRCDRERLPAYLEATSPDNARLYRRLGFVTTDVVRPLGSPPIELMTRRPAEVR
ncbi:MAG TPA: GNAT family N-acetyltransferase [Pseudonocardia sp.]|jgi:GNAT superfamily N-acetyltransferase|nr:GNAT family N-acetyltransferase [Pseudonocardia sp.]